MNIKLNFENLKKNLKKNFTGLQTIKIALLADSSMELLSQAIKGYGYELGVNLKVFQSEYQLEQQVLNKNSELYLFEPDCIIIIPSIFNLREGFYTLNKERKNKFSTEQIDRVENFYNNIISIKACRVICFNCPEVNDAVFGNYSSKVEYSFNFQLKKFNYELMKLSQKHENLFINDLSCLQNRHGYNFAFSPKIHVSYDIVFSIDFLPLVAKNIVDMVMALFVRLRKCLILDLDNVLWAGSAGDLGPENIQAGGLGIGNAFHTFQLWIKQLKERGIILAVCSKNDESMVKQVFQKHEEMALKLEDFSVFMVNWESKVDNIKRIQQILNIDFSAMVFIDNEPFERELVRKYLPQVFIPELPQDPADYLDFLQSLNLFEAASLLSNDERRPQQYREEQERAQQIKDFTNLDDFLRSLEMNAQIERFDDFNISRVEQLIQRSNQFNLRTRRYSQLELKQMIHVRSFITLALRLKDRIGDYGLVAVVVLRNNKDMLFIDTWIMSCRILKRTVEYFLFNEIVDVAKRNSVQYLSGEYLPTEKNKIVSGLYSDLGFQYDKEKNLWILDLRHYRRRNNFINEYV